MVLHITNLSWRREQKYILQNINWSIRHGEHWALLGLNGSGKTTLLNIINGYIWPTSGEVEVLGKKFGSFDLRVLRKSIGWVSSSLQEKLYRNETAEDIIISGKYATIGLYDNPVEDDRDLAMQQLQLLDCEHLFKRTYNTLSQGERQKVLIARALMSSPKLLILDEPCAGLDVFSREHLLNTIESLAQQVDAPTLIYVTHHIEEIMPVFNKTLLLKQGTVHSGGNTQEVLTSSRLSNFFNHNVEVQWSNERAWLKIL
ncbi:ABC transporter ATP-binding protein [Desulfuribacillus alkaliarsenatis]|uniref:Molybdenum ABC transporter ATP-binding protein n=1 Tax=Desulfuribacillus alkaliarsenatis TaxID=766136 RepID=A0A1E5FYV3_9FIRM|nr:ABC transporter ATP-binding protein [Desulfuribacillus alkaliarsenatis]OEF95718.1 molybdenum ABC transporter ATP-binding protein [Desulfuribacillus alkaliarsenatis]